MDILFKIAASLLATLAILSIMFLSPSMKVPRRIKITMGLIVLALALIAATGIANYKITSHH